MTKAQGRRHTRNANYYKGFPAKLDSRKARRAVTRQRRLKEIAAGNNLGSPVAIRRRRKIANARVNMLARRNKRD